MLNKSGRLQFSIVIPTRNRLETLRHCLEACLQQKNFDSYEIVINDNSDDGTTKDYIEALWQREPASKTRVRYHKRTLVCSMSENFDEAISRASGEYIIVIGDDDGIMPMALFEINELIGKTGAGIVKWRNGLYNWPTLQFQDAANYLGFCLQRSYRALNGRDELKKSLQTLQYENLPMLYINAAVQRHIIDMMRGSDGRIFRSRSPDVYSAVILSYICGQYLDTSIPFTLAGLSRASNGVSTAFGGEFADSRNDFNNLNAKAGIRLHPHVPSLAIYPVVDFAESFYFAKDNYFPNDDEFFLSRRHTMRACIERCDFTDSRTLDELMSACRDDKHLTDYVNELIRAKTETKETPRLKPVHLGADGFNMHIDPRDFGVTDIASAVNLVHRIVWPNDAPLRYDLG